MRNSARKTRLTKMFFKGKEAQNDQSIIRILGTEGEMTTWALTVRILDERSRKKIPSGRPPYSVISNANPVFFRRVKRLAQAGYIKSYRSKISKGNKVPLYGLTLRGFLVAGAMLEDKCLRKLIDVSYSLLVEETSTFSILDTKLLLDIWRIVSREDPSVFRYLFRRQIEETTSKCNLERAEDIDLLLSLMTGTCRDLLSDLWGNGESKISAGLVKMMEKDVQLLESVLLLIDWHWIRVSTELDSTSSRVQRTLRSVFVPALKSYECRNPSEEIAVAETARTVDEMEHREILTRVKANAPL